MSQLTNSLMRVLVPMGIVARPRRPRAFQRRFLPWLDPMEDRTLLSTLLVTNTQDSGSGSLPPRSPPPSAATRSRSGMFSEARRSRSRRAS